MTTSLCTSTPFERDILSLHLKLLMKAADILVVVLGDYSTKKLNPKVALEELTAILTEIASVWDCSDQPTRLAITDNVLHVDQVVELFYDMMHRTCKGMNVGPAIRDLCGVLY